MERWKGKRIMWFSLAKMALKTGTHIYQNKQKSKQLMSDAALLHSEKMAKGELEYKAKIIESNDNGWKDEFVLILVELVFAFNSIISIRVHDDIDNNIPPIKGIIHLWFFIYFLNHAFVRVMSWCIVGSFDTSTIRK